MRGLPSHPRPAAAGGSTRFPTTGQAWQGWGLLVHYMTRQGTVTGAPQPCGASQLTSGKGQSQGLPHTFRDGQEVPTGWLPKGVYSLALLAWRGTSARCHTCCWGRWGTRALTPDPASSVGPGSAGRVPPAAGPVQLLPRTADQQAVRAACPALAEASPHARLCWACCTFN